MRRRRLRLLAVPAAIALAAALAASWMLVIEPRWIAVTHTEIPLQDLEADLAGVRIALISDTHHGPFKGTGFLERAARIAAREEPDIVALAGDYVLGDARYAEPGIAPLGSIDAPLGTFAVLGNHDHWEGADAVRSALARHGIAILENEHRIVTRGDARLCIAGLEEPWEGAPDVHEALGGVDPDVPRILIVHNPDFSDALGPAPRVDLVLAGHTHGGQVVLPLLGPLVLPARREHAAGLVEKDHCLLYVTRGLGELAPPVRLGCRPEIAILTLVEAR